MPKKQGFPGTFLSYGEEYLPGKNAFEGPEGNIHSSSVGEVVFDEKQKVVSVLEKTRQPELIDVGSIIYGTVGGVNDSKAFVDIFEAQKNGNLRVSGSASAVLMVFNVKEEYVKDLHELFKVGDIVKARVLTVSKFTIDLETKSDPSLGVVKGFCTNCRVPLRQFHNGFKCPNCAMEANRKFSNDYLLKH
ncbi:MAG: exosome complex RNA-binding protein Csl4 [Candidatus Diapherotrites archaeon]|nr:exosome complex RNA-binding protein Csl4 [Candidatus Diapherotrites archaeon]